MVMVHQISSLYCIQDIMFHIIVGLFKMHMFTANEHNIEILTSSDMKQFSFSISQTANPPSVPSQLSDRLRLSMCVFPCNAN